MTVACEVWHSSCRRDAHGGEVTNMAHFLVERVNSLQLNDSPLPWMRHDWAIGGLHNVGYAPASDLLLVVSHQGRGVFDCLSNRKLARDAEEGNVEDREFTSYWGIGVLEGQIIHTSGIWGGCLHHRRSGWELELVSPNWPLSSIVLCPLGCGLYNEKNWQQCMKVAPNGGEDDIVTYGFSDTGKSFIVATSHTLQIFSLQA